MKRAGRRGRAGVCCVDVREGGVVVSSEAERNKLEPILPQLALKPDGTCFPCDLCRLVLLPFRLQLVYFLIKLHCNPRGALLIGPVYYSIHVHKCLACAAISAQLPNRCRDVGGNEGRGPKRASVPNLPDVANRNTVLDQGTGGK